MMYLILSTVLANADEAAQGYYNETEISKASTLFSEASKVSAPQFAQAESNIRSHDWLSHAGSKTCVYVNRRLQHGVHQCNG